MASCSWTRFRNRLLARAAQYAAFVNSRVTAYPAATAREWFTTYPLLTFLALTLLSSCAHKPDLPVLGEIPAFQLTDQTGATFASAQQLQGRVWVADFFFTNCPGPCPRMGSQMLQVQKAFEGSDLRLASMTVDPERDTPQVLAEYSTHFNAKPGVWYFLTGSKSDLNHLAQNVFKLGAVDGRLEHSTRFVLVDRKARVRGYYLTSEPDAIPRLIADAKMLLAEKI
jgi:protein SCO1